MTPKEKAEELVHRFRKYVDFTDENDHTSLKAIISNSKQCAIISVEEILNAHLFDEDEKEYWQQVRTEIENNFSGQSKQLPICKCENTERIEVGSGSWNIHCKDCGKNW